MENQNNNRPNNSQKDKKKKDDEFQWKKASKTGLIWIIILIAAISFSQFWPDNRPDEIEISYSRYQRRGDQKRESFPWRS